MSTLFLANRAIDAQGRAVSGAICRFFQSGTSVANPLDVYFDAGLTVSAGSFITANDAGVFRPVYLSDDLYGARFEDKNGIIIYDDIDPITAGGGGGSSEITFESIQAFRDSGVSLEQGVSVKIGEDFRYVVEDPSSADVDLVNQSGVSLKAVPDDAGVYRLGQFAPVYDDETVDNTALLVKAANRASGRTLKIDGTITLLTTAIIDTPVCIEGENALIKDPNNLQNLIWLQASGSKVKNITFESVETEATFTADPPVDATVVDGVTVDGAKSFIRVEIPSPTSSAIIKGVEVSNINASGKHVCVTFKRHNGCLAENITMTGFLPDTGPTEASFPNSRFCSAVVFLGGSYNSAINCRADNHGNVVLVGLTEIAPFVDRASGSHLCDNGVYISSGSKALVVNCKDIMNVAGTGIKMRGSNHVAQNCYVTRCAVGYVVTGNGVTADAYGANGHGLKLLNCSAEETYGYCFQITAQDGLLARDVIVDDFLSVGGGTAGGGFSGTMRVLSGGQVINSTFRDHKGGSYALIVTGVSTEYSRNITVQNNRFIGGTAHGVRVQYVSGGVVSGNIGDSVPNDLIEYRFVNFTNCYGNSSTTNGTVPNDVIIWSNSYPGDGNNFGLNTGRTYVHPNLLDSNYVAPQYGSISTLASSANTPSTVGQLAAGNGNIYVADGTASNADFIQIN